MELKLSKKLHDALNKQVSMELQSAQIYNGMRIYLKELGAYGAIKWMSNQAHEEIEHAEAFINFIQEMDGHVELGALEPVKTVYDSPLAVWEAGLAHEKEITSSILELLKLADKEENYAAQNFLRKFVDEQVEEEDNFRGIIDLWKLAGDSPEAILKVDGILGKRD